jgi:hypothetical protein
MGIGSNPLQKVSPKFGQGIKLGDKQGLVTTPQTPTTSPTTAPAITTQAQNTTTSGAGGASQLSPSATPSKTTPATTPTATGTPGLFGSVLNSLKTKSDKNKDQERLMKQLEENAKGNKAIGDEAKRMSEMYAAEIARIGQLGAGAVAGNLSTGTNVVGSGNAAIASQSASSRMQALSDAQQAGLEGTRQQFTGQEQAASALGTTLGAANTQQSTGVTALSQAGNLAQPNPTGYGQTVFDPTTGSFGGGQAGLDPAIASQQLAQAVKSGQMTYEQAVQSLG